MTFTREEKLKEVAREIALRRAVYPSQIARRRLKQEVADRQIAIMLEIAKDYGGHGEQVVLVSCDRCGWSGDQRLLLHDLTEVANRRCPKCGAVFERKP